MQGLLVQGVSAPLCPVSPRPPVRIRVHDRSSSPFSISFPQKITFPSIKVKSHLSHASPAFTPILKSHKHDFSNNLLQPTKKRGTYRPNASKDRLFNFEPHPKMTKKPEWWWRTLACLPYLMTVHDHRYWSHAHPASNQPLFLENFDNFVFPLLSAIFALPRFLVSCYAFLCWLGIVRKKFWPHFLRFHVITAVLIGSLVEVIGLASGWFPSWFYPPHFWSAATFVYLVTVIQCMVCALMGTYPDVPFVKDAAALHADLR